MKVQFFSFLFFVATTFIPQLSKAQEMPNIIFIFADDMGYGDVSCNNPYSRVSTPAIDQLAKEGIRFTEAHSAGSVCTPSRYGLITGRYFFRAPKQRSHWGYLSPYISPERETIGDMLKKSGYTTACIGKWHLGLNWQRKDKSLPLIEAQGRAGYTNVDFSLPVSGGPYDLGFDYSFIMPASLDMPPYVFVKNNEVVDQEIILTADMYPNRLEKTEFAWDKKYINDDDIYWERGVWWRNGEMSKSFNVEECLDAITKEGLAFIERVSETENPFFLYLPLTGPHTPWVPNKHFKGKTGLGTYGDFIMQIDNIVAQITELIKEQGIEKNTMIIFSSDNGAAWETEDILQYAHQSNWGRRGMKGDTWDGGHHIPLVIKWPEKIKAGTIYNYDIGLTDFYATFADMTHQEMNENEAEDSYSFMTVLNGNREEKFRDHIIYLSSSGKLAIKKGDWKYIQGLGSGGFSYPANLSPVKNGPTSQLYNMKKDIEEKNNLFLQKPKIAEELNTYLKKLVENGYSRTR
ncbi:sulfatase family protein [Maribellus maritimus]|uniref:sulfatase family protein n=1 Tax=Maribellus maritimus TaxID=2870838 RepID=UPI001EEC39BB|nr:arylsulfatase [Maribellus maritimus]MCG6190682.1 arylsulfatase [Maribellus maritimus]